MEKESPPPSYTLNWCKLKIKVENVDKIISAELPDIDGDPKVFETIKTQMIHDLCGVINSNSPSMQDKKNILSDIRKLIFEKLRLTMMDIPFAKNVSQKIKGNNFWELEERKLPWVING